MSFYWILAIFLDWMFYEDLKSFFYRLFLFFGTFNLCCTLILIGKINAADFLKENLRSFKQIFSLTLNFECTKYNFFFKFEIWKTSWKTSKTQFYFLSDFPRFSLNSPLTPSPRQQVSCKLKFRNRSQISRTVSTLLIFNYIFLISIYC